MASWGEIQDELARKSLATLETWALRHEAGLITDREFWLIVDSLYDAVCGLVSYPDCADVIYAVRQSLPSQTF